MDSRYSNLGRREKSRYLKKRWKCGYWHIELTRRQLIRSQLKFLKKKKLCCQRDDEPGLHSLFLRLKMILGLQPLWDEKQFTKAAGFPRKAVS